MERIIKFRGKRKDNGEWVTGYFWRMNDERNGNKACITVSNVGADDFFNYEVLPETVGQFSGLLDSEGKEIFEDDIVLSKKFWKYRYSDNKRWKRFNGLVVFEVSQTTGQAEWDVVIKDQEDYDYEAYGPFDDCKVVSNIHDAPHLLTPLEGERIHTMTDPNLKAEGQEAVGAVEEAKAETANEQATQESAEEGTTEG